MTTGQIKGVFAGTVQARYGLKRSDALNAISSVIPYIPVRKKKIGVTFLSYNMFHTDINYMRQRVGCSQSRQRP